MAAESVIRFVLDGTGKVVQGAQAAGAAIQKAGQQAANFGGGINSKEGRMYGGKFAKIGKFATNLGPLGQVGEAISSSPTAGLAAVSVGALAAGIALKQFGAVAQAQIKTIEDSIRTRNAARDTVAGAVASANQSAVSAVLGRKEELVGGDRGSAELRKWFGKMEDIQKQTQNAQVERALKFGEDVMRQELVRTKSPEAVAIGELNKAAEQGVEVQREIRDKMNWFQKAVVFIANGTQGRSYNADLIDAIDKQVATSAGAN